MTASLDPVIHPINRLRICAMLSAATQAEFGTLQRQLELSASNLSKQLTQLASHGYVEQHRTTADARRVWISLTPLGRQKYTDHMAALGALADGPAEPSS